MDNQSLFVGLVGVPACQIIFSQFTNTSKKGTAENIANGAAIEMLEDDQKDRRNTATAPAAWRTVLTGDGSITHMGISHKMNTREEMMSPSDSISLERFSHAFKYASACNTVVAKWGPDKSIPCKNLRGNTQRFA